jgi:hypothetical protein
LPWLVLPVSGVLLLAAFAPKFNTRYVMLALPGLLMIWSAGIAALWEERAERRTPGQGFLSIAALALLLATFTYATYNWFFVRAFHKDEWRELAAFLRAQLEPQELVILVSGHAWPVWHYYAPDLPTLRLPEIDVLDVEAVLDFANTVDPLRTAFAEPAGKAGAWLVGWQEDVVDPTGIVPLQLELAGREKGQSARFWGLELRRFSQIRPHRLADAPPMTNVVDTTFGGQLTLRGYHVMTNGDVLLFWQRAAASDANVDYQISGQTLRSDGTVLVALPDRRPAAYAYPVARWQADEVVVGQLPATQWLGPTPAPGTYTLQVSVYTLAGDTATTLAAADGRTVVELPVAITEFD